jgi:SP family sugar:H+ symporter-like MFS transporter
MDSGYANLQSKVGFIYGSLSIASIGFVYFCVPECHGRSFEEIDQLFRKNTPLRKFHARGQSLGDVEADITEFSESKEAV